MKIFKGYSKINKNQTFRNIFIFTIVFILVNVSFLFLKFSHRISDNMIQISEAQIQNITYHFITDKINHNLFNKDTLSDILIITKNKNDEILYVDFNYDQAYKLLDSVSLILNQGMNDLETGNIELLYYDDKMSHKTNGLVLSIPIGSILKNVYYYNWGPKIPIKINFVGSVLTNLQTKITNYGLNNALVEVFVYIEIHNQIMAPFKTKDIELKYDAVIASMMIEGKVPEFYSGSITKESETYSKSLE